MNRARTWVGALAMSLAAFATWQASEGFTPAPMIPTQGDVPTIGYGSTRYEDGTPVTLADPPITRDRAEHLARALHDEEERRFRASLPGVKLFQEEYDLYLDFSGQYGSANWRKSSMRRYLLAGEYAKACDALLMWRKAGGYDCSALVNGKPNKRCWGVWTRQLERHAQCWSAQ